MEKNKISEQFLKFIKEENIKEVKSMVVIKQYNF